MAIISSFGGSLRDNKFFLQEEFVLKQKSEVEIKMERMKAAGKRIESREKEKKSFKRGKL